MGLLLKIQSQISYKIFGILVGVFILLTLLLQFGSVAENVVADPNQWTVKGHFEVESLHNNAKVLEFQSKGGLLWESGIHAGENQGELISPLFKAPRFIALFVGAFFPSDNNLHVYLEKESTKERFSLNMLDSPGHRIETAWVLPTEWVGEEVRLRYVDQSTISGGWMIASSPQKINWVKLLQIHLGSLTVVPVYIFHFFLFWIPGLTIAYWILGRFNLSPKLFLVIALIANGFLGFVSFWVYFFKSDLGKQFSYVIAGIAIWGMIQTYRKHLLPTVLHIRTYFINWVMPLTLMFLIGLFYVAIAFSQSQSHKADMFQFRFFDWVAPDNIIPQRFSEKLYDNEDPRKILGNWLSSDRPPLQAGIVLSHRPWMDKITETVSAHYQILGIILQSTWVIGIWLFCLRLKLSIRQSLMVILFCAFSGFFLFNSLFVWPKLLAATFCFFSFIFLVPQFRFPEISLTVQVVLASVAAGLGMLSHGGIFFTLFAIALFLLIPRYFLGIKHTILGIVLVLLIYSPWVAYQRFYNPPGDNLLKVNLAHVMIEDERPASQAISDAYGALTSQQIVENKWGNFYSLWNPKFLKYTIGLALQKPGKWANFFYQKRKQEAEHIIQTLGLLHLGWLILVGAWFLKKPPFSTRPYGVLFGILGVNLFLWLLILFGPGMASIHSGSYAAWAMLFSGLSALIVQLPKKLSVPFFGIYSLLFFLTWVVNGVPEAHRELLEAPNIPLYVTVALSLFLLGWFFRLTLHKLGKEHFDQRDPHAI